MQLHSKSSFIFYNSLSYCKKKQLINVGVQFIEPQVAAKKQPPIQRRKATVLKGANNSL